MFPHRDDALRRGDFGVWAANSVWTQPVDEPSMWLIVLVGPDLAQGKSSDIQRATAA